MIQDNVPDTQSKLPQTIGSKIYNVTTVVGASFTWGLRTRNRCWLLVNDDTSDTDHCGSDHIRGWSAAPVSMC